MGTSIHPLLTLRVSIFSESVVQKDDKIGERANLSHLFLKSSRTRKWGKETKKRRGQDLEKEVLER